MLQQNTTPTAPLYTEHPFPDDGVVRTSTARILRAGIEKYRPELLSRKSFRIIDVGCGTGEVTAGLARHFPQAEVVGIDINPPSLQRAQLLAQRLGQRTKFVQANILEDLPETLRQAGLVDEHGFDVVVSIGVLHSVAEPLEGFRQVRQLANPDTLFLCFMYSRHGRREDMAVKGFLNEASNSETSFSDRVQMVQLLGIANRDTPSEVLRVVRHRLKFGPPMVPSEMMKLYFMRNRMSRLSDTFSNPCEYLYSFGELEQMCAESQWDVIDLAERGGLPVSIEEHTSKPSLQKALRELPRDVLYDYFAFYYHTRGFHFFARPQWTAPRQPR